MTTPMPFWREAGKGPTVICLHANASVCGQWRPLMDRLGGRCRVLAPDSYGAGRSPEWGSDRVITLADEVDLLAPVIARAGERFALVGHSYGAAIALKAAVLLPGRIAAVALYEPTLFALIEADGPPPNEADGIRDVVMAAAAALEAGDRDAAARSFIDYWMGPDSWQLMPAERQGAIAAAIVNVRRWAHALFTEPTPLAAFATLDVPVLLMTGGRSTPSAHGVARRLLSALPRVSHVDFPELGHMGPVTHPAIVDAAIEAFLVPLLAASPDW